ncbi:Uncharacterized protein Fot_39363 [Forsythia ovata]|uniref:Uncharacterized protein n=1 Tax=Forsythia ovata TaxID=205694 RepID=A0ABD1S4D3_9LAMI
MNAASLTVCRYGKRVGTTQLSGFATLQKLVHMRSDARINGVAAVEGRIISVHFSSKLEAAPVPYPVSFEIPIILNAIGGILVGLVTTYAGGTVPPILTDFELSGGVSVAVPSLHLSDE